MNVIVIVFKIGVKQKALARMLGTVALAAKEQQFELCPAINQMHC